MGINKFVLNFIRSKGAEFDFADEDEDEEEEEEEDSVKSSEEAKEKKKNPKVKLKNNDMNPIKQRVWKLDNLRLDDYKKMKEIAGNLVKMRKKDQRKFK